ncbi:MAG: Maf family protein [Eubacteriales bacterium]
MSYLILASASPRRAELLTMLGLPFSVCPADTDESLPAGIPPRDAVETLARRKALSAAGLANADRTGKIVLAADTLVALGDRILGKPKDEEDAKASLRMLSGSAHRVYSGIALAAKGRIYTAVECTEVHFRELTDGEIERYVASGEPMDKAGSYGIQGRAGIFIKGISGDYYNVVGLPLCALEELSRHAFGKSLYEIAQNGV